MKKTTLLFLIMIAVLQLSAEKLTLFFTNDTHGAYLLSSYKTAEGSIELGGFENLYNLISAQRDTLENSLWVDAGDEQTGSVFSSLTYKGVSGGAVVEAFNKMGLDAATFGNHEFDQSYENTRQLIKLAKYPYVSSNLVDKKTRKAFNDTPYKIFKKGSLRIGILGLTLTELPEKVKTQNVSSIDVLPYKQAIDKYIDELDKKTDLIILLTHIGIEADSLLATQLDNRVDLIVGGHTHAVTEQPKLVNGIYIVQAGSHLVYLGKLNLDIKNDRIANPVSDDMCLIPVEKTISNKENDFSAFFEAVTAKIDKDMNRVIGYTEVDWIPDKYRESVASQWQAKALFDDYKDKRNVDIAMLNCGGIRKAIPAGEIKVRDMTEMLPFTNYITFFSCYGKDLKGYIELNLGLMNTKEHDIIQSYNLNWQTKDAPNESQVWDIRVNNEPIVADKVYRIVSHDYVAGQWDKYLGFKPFDIDATDDLIYDVMVRQVEKQLGKKKL
jgi:5'-nucleotidase/UDP-sugar diphosphatase